MVDESVLTEAAHRAAAEAGVDAGLLGGFLAGLADTVAAGGQLDRSHLDRCHRRGALAARRGVALRALIDLHLGAVGELWPHLPGVVDARGPEPVVEAGRTLWRAVDDAVGALTDGYQLARRDVVREQEASRRELVDDLLLGGGDLAGLTRRAAGLGLDLSGPHAVAVVTADRAFADAAALTRDVERAVLGRRGDADVLVASKDGRLVVVFAAPDAAAVAFVGAQVASVLGPQPLDEGVQLRRRAGVGRWRIGLGPPGVGPAGVRRSYEQAGEALDIAGRVGLPDDIVDAADLRLYRVLLADRAALGELVDGTLGPLAAARGGAQPLIDTLRVYVAARANASETARRLHLSVRAVTYRIERIAALSGYDPTDPADLLQLHLAVLAAQLIEGAS